MNDVRQSQYVMDKGRRRITVMVMLLMLGLSGCGDNTPDPVYPQAPPPDHLYDQSTINDEQRWTINNAHDPAIIKTDQGYYVYSTDVKTGGELRPGVMVRKSTDLIHWNWVQYALPGIPKEAEAWSSATNLWAPDIIKMGDTYRMYYSASTFGSTRSAIGLQTSSSPEGPWKDEGLVVKTGEHDKLNAIDANPVLDAEGNPWMVYGSFFGGIYITPLDLQTGKLKESGYGKNIAARDRATEDGAVEGPYIVYNPMFRKYYLFVSYDSLFEDYNVRVARSDSITGPYVDMNGHDMADTSYLPQYEIGNKVLGGYRFSEGEGWVAPGHNSVLKDGADYYIVHHARGETDKSWPYLHVRKILWTAEGWPVVSPERYAGEKEQDIPKRLLSGNWERIVIRQEVDGQVEAEPLRLEDGGRATSGSLEGHWSFDGKRTLTMDWSDTSEGTKEELLLLPSWDWELGRHTLIFTGMNEKGISIWGKRISD